MAGITHHSFKTSYSGQKSDAKEYKIHPNYRQRELIENHSTYLIMKQANGGIIPIKYFAKEGGLVTFLTLAANFPMKHA